MKLPDTNIWLALTLSKHSRHHAARAWLDQQEAAESIVFCRATQQSLLRLITTASLMSLYGIPPLSNREAWGIYGAFLADDRIHFQPEPVGVEECWKKLAARRSSSPKLWMDAYLAALAIRGGYELVTDDKAFSQFPSLNLHLIQ